MASSAPPEAPLTIWGSLRRMREISRLVLAAIERDDLDEIERLMVEGQALAGVIGPVLSRMREGGTVTPELAEHVEGLSGSMQAILGGLRARRDATGRELGEVRRNRARLRTSGLNGAPASSRLDRTT